MKIDDISLAIAEAERFIERACVLRSTLVADETRVEAELAANPAAYAYHHSFPKEQGSVRRASMDLTRALAKMRRPGRSTPPPNCARWRRPHSPRS